MPTTTHELRPSERLRSLHIPGTPLVLFNVWDAGSARAVCEAGARAIATGSWSVASANGFADGEHISLAFALGNLRRIAGAADLPVTIDLETGYAGDPQGVGETVRAAVDAGASGCNLEDSLPADGHLREAPDQAARIRAARESADEIDGTFFINARTDVFFQTPSEQHDDAMVALALERARAYAQAGADGIFVPGLVDIALIARLAERSPLPVNVMIEERSPAVRTLAEGGVARVSYGPVPYLAAMEALRAAARLAFKI